MVLEESLIFDYKENASEFIQFLRKGGCKSRIVPRIYTSEEELLIGSIDNFIAMLDNQINEYSDECELSEYDDAAQAVIKVQRGDLIHNIKSIKCIKEELTKLMETYNPGDLIHSKADHYSRLMEDMQAILKEPENEDEQVRVTRNMNYAVLQMALEDNNITEDRDGDVYLTKKMSNPGELILERSVPRTIPSGSLDAEEYDISMKVICSIDLVYEVIIDPKIHIAFSPDTILSFIENFELDMDSVDILERHLYEKNLIIGQFLTQLEQVGPISLEKFTALMEHPTVDENLPEERAYSFTPEFIAALVSDLRKLRIIKGNNRNIHI